MASSTSNNFSSSSRHELPNISTKLRVLEEKLQREGIEPVIPVNVNLTVGRSTRTRPRPGHISGGSCSPSRASSAPPTRKGTNFQLPLSPLSVQPYTSEDIRAKYLEVIKNSGLLYINEVQQRVDLKDLRHLCDLGHGSCGQV
ncbi:unnamed protein product, partial [Didymodactylos carnosus]